MSTPDGAEAAPFSAAQAEMVMLAAARSAGLETAGSRLMRLGENALFLLPSPQVVVRIARSMAYWPDALREVHVAQWLGEIEFPAAQLHDVQQPLRVSDHPVTFWRFIAGRPGDRQDLPALGRVLRRLHSLPRPTTFDLAPEEIFGRVSGRIAATPVPDDDKDFLAQRLANLTEAVTRLDFPLPAAPTHGDAHSENLMIGGNGEVILIDFERFAWGQPEWDLAMTATEYVTAGWWTDSEYRAFADSYGYDVMSWEGFDVLREVHELKMTTWLMQNVAESPEIAREYENRMSTLRGATRSPWRPF